MVTLFSYKQGNSFFHKLDARIKLVLLLACACAIFSLPLAHSAILCALTCAALLAAGFTVREITSLFKVVLYYALVLQATSLLAHIFERSANQSFSSSFFSYGAPLRALLAASVRTSDMILVARLALAILASSLLYRTTSPLALREAVEDAECFVHCAFGKKSKRSRAIFSSALSLLLAFIPLVFTTWKSVTRAWKARRGKSGIRMLLTLLPVFFSVCMKKAHATSLALQNRTTAL